MITSTKTRRRLMLAAVITLFCILAVTASFFLKRRSQAQYASLREHGLAAFRQNDPAAALAALSPYLDRHRDDAEAMLCAARARHQAPLPGGKHLIAAAGLYHRYLELKPDDVAALRDVAAVYAQLGYSREAVDAASRVLLQLPDDADALRLQAGGLAGLRRLDEALAAAERSAAIAPDNLETQVLILRLCADLKQTEEALTRAVAFANIHPGDPRAELLLGAACLLAREIPPELVPAMAALLDADHGPALPEDPSGRELAARFLGLASAHTPPEPFFVRTLLAQLDLLAMPQEAARVLDRVTDRMDDPELRLELIRRLFELNWHAELAARTDTLKLDEPNADLMAMRAISLIGLGRREQAGAIAAALASRPEDVLAHAWAVTLQAMISPAEGQAPAVAAAIQQADQRRRTSCRLRFCLAETQAGMRQREEAIRTLRQVVSDAPLWPAPRVRLSQLLLAAGQREPALEEAKAAAGLLPRLAEVVNLATILAAQPKRTQRSHGLDLLALLEEIQRQAPGEEQTLPLYVAALADAGRADEARQTIQGVLNAEQPPPGTWLLLRLAEASREAAPALEEACYRKILRAHPRHAVALNNLATLLLRENHDAAETVRLAEQAVAVMPDLATLHDTLASAHAKQQQYDQAVASLRSAVRLEPNNPRWRIHLAALHLQAGHADDAVAALAEARTLITSEDRLPPALRQQFTELASKLEGPAQDQ